MNARGGNVLEYLWIVFASACMPHGIRCGSTSPVWFIYKLLPKLQAHMSKDLVYMHLHTHVYFSHIHPRACLFRITTYVRVRFIKICIESVCMCEWQREREDRDRETSCQALLTCAVFISEWAVSKPPSSMPRCVCVNASCSRVLYVDYAWNDAWCIVCVCVHVTCHLLF